MSEKLMPYQVFINYLRRKKGKEPKYGEDVSETGDYSPEIADVDVSESGGDYDDSIEHVQVDVDESTEGQKSFDAPSLAKRKKCSCLLAR